MFLSGLGYISIDQTARRGAVVEDWTNSFLNQERWCHLLAYAVGYRLCGGFWISVGGLTRIWAGTAVLYSSTGVTRNGGK